MTQAGNADVAGDGLVTFTTGAGQVASGYLGDPIPAGPSLRQPTRLAQTVITQFQSGHGFAKAAGTGSQTDDTASFVQGTQSLRINTLGDASAYITQHSSISPTINASNMQLRITFKITGIANLADLSLYLSSDNAATTNYHQSLLTIANAVTQPYCQDGEWVTYTLNFGEFILTSTPDRTALNFVKLRVADNGNGPVTVNFQAITMEAVPATGIVSICFDDGWQSTYTIAAPYLTKNGLRASAHLIRDLLGQPSYLTLDQAKQLQDYNGFDIGCHADTVNLHNSSGMPVGNLGYPVGVADSVLLADQLAIKAFLLKNGFKRSDVYAWPHGYFTASQMIAARPVFSGIRGVCGGQGGINGHVGPHETYPPGDPYRLRSWLLASSDVLANLTTALTQCSTFGTWLILTFHQIVASGASGGTQINTSVFTSMIDAIVAQSGVKVKTVAEVFETGAA